MKTTKKNKGLFPERIFPMLGNSGKEPFNNPDWLYEIKWDGYRVLAEVHNGKAKLYTKDGKDCTNKYMLVANELEGQKDMILDGEVVVLDVNGKPDYNALQSYDGKGDLVYYTFDLLYYEGVIYLNKPLLQRKEMLLHVLKKESILTYSDHFDDGVELFHHMQQLGLEGMVAKRKESIYRPRMKSKDWINIKVKDKRIVQTVEPKKIPDVYDALTAEIKRVRENRLKQT